MNDTEKMFSDFLKECNNLLKNIDKCREEDIIETYRVLNICAKKSCAEIATIDTNYRVEICRLMDEFLDCMLERVSALKAKGGNVFTPAIQGYRSWTNVELLKDKGLVGYMLAKEIAAKSHMFFAQVQSPENAEKLGGGVLISG